MNEVGPRHMIEGILLQQSLRLWKCEQYVREIQKIWELHNFPGSQKTSYNWETTNSSLYFTGETINRTELNSVRPYVAQS